jgi:hypothetical protein
VRHIAISRDIYDIHHLVQSGVTAADVTPLLPAKFEARGLNIETLAIEQMTARRPAFENDWDRRLSYLVEDTGTVTFALAWNTSLTLLQRVQGILGQQSSAPDASHGHTSPREQRTFE